MHAYLIIGPENLTASEIKSLTAKLKAKTVSFSLQKIEDIRELSSFIKLSLSEPTAICIKNIDNATTEALNAFLKNLEEPQENLYYILTAAGVSKVLPTIASRCQIIKVHSANLHLELRSRECIVQSEKTKKFLNGTIGEKLAEIDKIREREDAQNFVTDLVSFLHYQLTSDTKNALAAAENAEKASLTLQRLKANGNVQLQLTNMVVNLV
jgi:DNA polymerase III delta prime subunit